MASSYVVMQPPGDAGQERVLFVRDGFAVLALIVPFIWLAWHRLWLEALAVFAVVFGIGVLGQITGWGALLTPAISLMSLFVALEAGALRIAGLERRGWTIAGVVDGANADEAEIRWFADQRTVSPPSRTVPASPAAMPARQSGPALGLLTYPERS